MKQQCRDWYETVGHVFVHAYYEPHQRHLSEQPWKALRWASLPLTLPVALIAIVLSPTLGLILTLFYVLSAVLQPLAELPRYGDQDATRMDPVPVLGALAAVTTRIGLGATRSTTYDAPYNIAREFATLRQAVEG